MSHNLARAKALLEKLRYRTEARGATAAEAAQAADLAERLIERYGLDAIDAATIEESADMAGRQMPSYAIVLAMTMCERFGVEGHYAKGGGRNAKVMFRGAEHQAAVACWLFRAVLQDLQKTCQRSAELIGVRGSQLVRFRNRYLLSAAWQVWHRMTPPREALQGPEGQTQSGKPSKRSRRRKRPRITDKDLHAVMLGRQAGQLVSLDTAVIGNRQPAALHIDGPVVGRKRQSSLF